MNEVRDREGNSERKRSKAKDGKTNERLPEPHYDARETDLQKSDPTASTTYNTC